MVVVFPLYSLQNNGKSVPPPTMEILSGHFVIINDLGLPCIPKK